MIITDTAAKLAEIRELIEQVDIPVRQVMIESRIVIAQSDLTHSLGIEWGGGYIDDVNGNILSASGDAQNVIGLNNSIINGETPSLIIQALYWSTLASPARSGFALGFT